MNRGFTLVEMLVSIILTAIVFTYIYATLNSVKKSQKRYMESEKTVTKAQKIFSIFLKDITELRESPYIVHRAGFDRISFVTDNSIYSIARPWVHYYISSKSHALIRVESTRQINFLGANYISDANGTYFFADKLAEGCDSFRVANRKTRMEIILKCKDTAPIAMTLYKGEM